MKQRNRIYDRYGRDVTDEYGDDGFIKDGHRVHASIFMMDGREATQDDINRAVADRRRKRGEVRDPRGRLLHSYEEVEEFEEDAMADSEKIASAWRNRERALKGQPVDGKTYTIVDSAGHVIQDTSSIERSPEFAAALTRQAMRDEAYRSYVAETENAWRTKPAPGAAPAPVVVDTTPRIAVTDEDRRHAQEVRDQAWNAMRDEMCNAWRHDK
jgi:hypothetical protein